MPSGTPASFGRNQVAEPFHHMALLHRTVPGTILAPVTHTIPLGVLDQEDYGAQGISVPALVPGAIQVDGLGNCVFNAGTAAVSFLGPDRYAKYVEALLGDTVHAAFSDTKVGEEAAIVGYHDCTTTTGNPATEWPPTDCGSDGVSLVHWLTGLGIVSSQRIAAGPQDVVSLLQEAPVLLGGPWFNSWMEPGPLGMIDGNGTPSDIQAAVDSGVAGGHERLEFGVESLLLDQSGRPVPEKTILVDRNSWGTSWGDAGCYRVHLSTYMALSNYSDWRSLVA